MPSGYRSHDRRDHRLVAVALAGFCAFLDLYATQALLPLLAREFEAGPGEVSLTVSAITTAIALIAPFTGAVADVLGRKRVITAAMFALILPTLLIAAAGGLPAIIFWRFVQGLLLPPVFAVTVAYIGEEWSPAEATTMTGIYLAASSFGGFTSRFLTGLVAEHWGWRAAFVVLALLTLLAAVGVAALLPRERRFQKTEGLLASFRHMLHHLRDPRLVATFAVGFGVLFSFIAVFTYVNFHLAAPPYGLGTAALGSIFIVYLVGVVVTPQAGRLVARLGRRRLVVLAVAIWGGGLALTLTPPLPLIIAGLAIIAAAGFLTQTVATSYVAITAQQARSSAVGLYVTCYYVGGSLGGLLPGFVWERAGWPGCVAIVAALLFMMTGLVLRFWR
jgi:predicted MFS family arabinose efflux permease